MRGFVYTLKHLTPKRQVFHYDSYILNCLMSSLSSSAIWDKVAEDELISSIDASCSSAEAAIS